MAGIKSRTLAACCGDSGKGEPLNRENLADAIGQWLLDELENKLADVKPTDRIEIALIEKTLSYA